MPSSARLSNHLNLGTYMHTHAQSAPRSFLDHPGGLARGIESHAQAVQGSKGNERTAAPGQ
eukprot:3292798-Pleurochrysis_carterae.AAC.1